MIAKNPLEVPAGIKPEVVLVVDIQATGELVMAKDLLELGSPEDDGMGAAVDFLQEAVLVENPAVAGVVFAGVGDRGGGREAAWPGAILVDGDDLPVEVSGDRSRCHDRRTNSRLRRG